MTHDPMNPDAFEPQGFTLCDRAYYSLGYAAGRAHQAMMTTRAVQPLLDALEINKDRQRCPNIFQHDLEVAQMAVDRVCKFREGSVPTPMAGDLPRVTVKIGGMSAVHVGDPLKQVACTQRDPDPANMSPAAWREVEFARNSARALVSRLIPDTMKDTRGAVSRDLAVEVLRVLEKLCDREP
jgi:hypothetical protein